MSLLNVKIHDIWTSVESQDDFAVKDIGMHTNTGETIIVLSDVNGDTLCYPYDSFLDNHSLTHRMNNYL